MKKQSKFPKGRRGLYAWMVHYDGLLMPDLWDFTRRDAIEKAEDHKMAEWSDLAGRGWSVTRVYIAAIPRGFKLEVKLRAFT